MAVLHNLVSIRPAVNRLRGTWNSSSGSGFVAKAQVQAEGCVIREEHWGGLSVRHKLRASTHWRPSERFRWNALEGIVHEHQAHLAGEQRREKLSAAAVGCLWLEVGAGGASTGPARRAVNDRKYSEDTKRAIEDGWRGGHSQTGANYRRPRKYHGEGWYCGQYRRRGWGVFKAGGCVQVELRNSTRTETRIGRHTSRCKS